MIKQARLKWEGVVVRVGDLRDEKVQAVVVEKVKELGGQRIY